MSVRVQWTGLAEFERELRQMPDVLNGESVREAIAAANASAVEIRSEYGKHVVTGKLRDSVTVSAPSSGFGGGQFVRLRVGSPIAWLFDHGSQARHWITGSRKSTGRMWGKRPPQHVFTRTVVRQRRSMYDRLKAMLIRKGFQVSGDV